MTLPLLLARLRPPPLRGVVRRTYLIDRLDAGFAAGLTLIVAPAGFGKTTLAAAWLEHLAAAGANTAWLALGEAESDPARFLDYLAAALRRLDPAIGADLSAGRDPAAHASILIALLNHLTALIEEQPEQRYVLAIDDLHLAESTAVDALLSTLALHLPAGFQLLLISRIDPAMPLARLRATGRLCEIRERDLRFNRDEAAAFFSETMGLKLDEAAIAALHGRTEGWVAGLQLAALAVRDNHESEQALIADFAASHRYVLDYLSDEVLRGLPPETMRFLLITAPLNRMCAPLCDALRDSSDSAVLLDRLAQSNLFVVPLDPQGVWYRYHHLFADLLRREAALRDPQSLPQLHQRASDWYAMLAQTGDQDALAEALHHAAAAPDSARLAQLLSRHADQIWQRGELDLLRGRLSALAQEQLAAYPTLAVHLAWLQITAGQYQAGMIRCA
ncbi:MAG: AAA family ATPase [Oscillochloris sp.]|nr:AAA family ATPase [Oscillochloris sp.]